MEIKEFKNPEAEYCPDVRWWLAEGLHTDQTLLHDLDMLKESGFGAIEFLAMDDPGADDKLYGWGSEEWVHDSQLLFKETTKREMGVSTTCGTNWSNCNLTSITPDDKAAAKELDYEIEHLKPGEKRSGKVKECNLIMHGVTKQELLEVVAIRDLGIREDGRHYLDPQSAQVLTNKVEEGCLEFQAPEDGEYILFFFWIHGTGQTAGPSASVSYTINYMDRYGVEAFKEYWDKEVLTPELKDVLKKNGRAMMYMDSLELVTFSKGGQLWGYTILEEFQRRRGYDLSQYLPFIVKSSGGMEKNFQYTFYMENQVFSEKLYNDLYQTMTDLYMHNMLEPMREWCNKNHMWLRAEISYGLPFEISQPGKYVDDVETESLEFASQIDSYRGMAGTAHVYDRLFSSETGATMMNYKLPMDFFTQIIYTQFAAGVTKTVLHGYSSIAGSEDATRWPGHEGMWSMFSERFGSRQPAYQHYKDWTAMVARYQKILRRGKPRIDLAILRLDYNYNNLICLDAFSGMDETELYTKHMMRAHEGIYWKDMHLQDAGYTWDYFAPQLLEEEFVDYQDGMLLPNGPGYRGLIVYQEMMPLSSAKKILELAKKGLTVIIVNGCTELIRPDLEKTHKKAAAMTPFNDGQDEQLASVMEELKQLSNVRETNRQEETLSLLKNMGILPRTAFRTPNEKILTLSKVDGDKIIVYAYNMMYTDEQAVSFEMEVEGKGQPYRLHCENGEIEKIGNYKTTDTSTVLQLELMPGEACLYIINTAEESIHVVDQGGLSVFGENGKLYVRAFSSGDYAFSLSNGTVKNIRADIPESIVLKQWELEVEDWNEGEKIELLEDRGNGHVTKEVYYNTTKEKRSAGIISLKPWNEIEKIGPEVSGVGYYKTSFTLPENWDTDMGAVVRIKSTNKNTAAIYINGEKAPSFDISRLQTDISELVKSGNNEIIVEVSSTLNNRLLARGYFDAILESSLERKEATNNTSESPDDGETESVAGAMFSKNFSSFPQEYGMR